MSHSRSSGLKHCRTCGMYYPARVLWCPRCYDADGQPRVAPQSSSSVREQPRRSALGLLSEQIVRSGYWDNVTDIAYGRLVAQFPQPLALAVIYHDPWHGVDPEVEALAREWLARAFHVEVKSEAEAQPCSR